MVQKKHSYSTSFVALPKLHINAGLLFIVLSVITCNTFGQSLKGRVLEVNGNPLPFVNVLLLNSSDSALVKAAVSDSLGVYTLDNVKVGTYLLSARMIGFKQNKPLWVTITTTHAQEVETLVLEEDAQQLKEVVIAEKRPFIEHHADRLIVSVSNSIIASGSTALEILEKAPGVTVDRQNDEIQLSGKNGVIVQVDGKQTYLSMPDLIAMLRNMSSDNIDQIELITNPSAKHDAAGNAGIINVRIKKNNSVGYNGSLSLSGGSGRYDRERAGLQLNHRGKKFNLFANYSGSRGGNFLDIAANQRNRLDDQTIYSDQDSYIRFLTWGHNAKIGLDYYLSKNTTVGLVWNGFWDDHREIGKAKSEFARQIGGPLFLHVSTDKQISNVASNQIGNINIQHNFADGSQLTVDFDRGSFKRDFLNTLHTHTLVNENGDRPSAKLINEMPTEIAITTAKIDYIMPVTAGTKLEIGFKHSSVWNDNDLTLSRGDDGNVEVDEDLSNHFRYTEQVNAGYANLNGKLGDNTNFQFGLRAEHTHSVGNSITFGNEVRRNYLNLFPTLWLQRTLKPNHSLGFSYSYRIDRPNYQNLNPARSYVDPYLYTQGNAYLQPQYTHSLELKHGFKDQVFTSLGASFTDNQILFIIQPVDSLTSERIPLNFARSQSYNLTIGFTIHAMEGWNIQTSVLGIYNNFRYTFQEIPLNVQQISGRLNVSNSIVLGKEWTGEITGWLRAPSINAIYRSPWLGSIDAGVQKAFGPRLKFKLSAQDVFRSNRNIGKIRTPYFYREYHLTFDTRIVMVNFTYSFGNRQIKEARQRKTGSEDESKRINSN